MSKEMVGVFLSDVDHLHSLDTIYQNGKRKEDFDRLVETRQKFTNSIQTYAKTMVGRELEEMWFALGKLFEALNGQMPVPRRQPDLEKIAENIMAELKKELEL